MLKSEEIYNLLKIIEFRPVISSNNIGDYIIQESISNLMNEMFGIHWTTPMPTRSKLSKSNYWTIWESDLKFVCGTNLLSSDMWNNIQWNLKLNDMHRLRDVILLGCGWREYKTKPSFYTKKLFRHILSSKYLHSVRDSYTEHKLKEMGINNVVNTSCPTMWGLTTDMCKMIPKKKAASVITTLTDYSKDEALDKWLLHSLLNNYDNVIVWLQGGHDWELLKEYGVKDNVQIIPPSLEKYDEALNYDVDYVGTRLHGGIRALNKGRRSLIIAVDNRAAAIAKDTNLPIVERGKIKESLEELINSEFSTDIKLPEDNIKLWKNQFEKFKKEDEINDSCEWIDRVFL